MNDYTKSSDWIRFRKDWLKRHPPLDNHCYLCSICGRWVSEDEVTLDHVSGRDGDLMFDEDNVRPSHGYCNYIKGSRRLNPLVDADTYEFLYKLSNM